MTSELDWVFWTVGGLLGLGGLVLLWWALFADRSKGRKRCPKCWYNMSHTPSLTCSECGYTAKREKKLRKTHRRWRWAVVAVLLLLGSASSSLTPKVKRDGWYTIIPSTVLILLVFEHDVPPFTGRAMALFGQSTKSDNPSTELAQRIYEKTLWSWQWRLLANQLHPGNDVSWLIDFSAREEWPVGEPFYATISLNNELHNLYWLYSSELRIQVKADLPNALTWSKEFYSALGFLYPSHRRKSTSVFPHTTGIYRWIEPSHLVGAVSEGKQVVTLNVTLERRDDSDDDEPWKMLWEGEYKHDLDVYGSVDDILQPITSLELKRTYPSNTIKAIDYGIVIDRQSLSSIQPGVFGTYALKFELLKNGNILREAEAWWWWAPDFYHLPGSAPVPYLVAWDKPLPVDKLSKNYLDSWSLRVSTVPELALRHVPRDPKMKKLRYDLGLEELDDSGDYIPCDVTYQLRWLDDQQQWIVDP